MTNPANNPTREDHFSQGSGLSADELSEILNTVSDAVCVIAPDGKFLWANTVFCDSLGIKCADWTGKNISDGVSKGFTNVAIVYDAIRTDAMASGIIRLKDGSERIVRCRPLKDISGKTKCFVSTSTSLHELNHLWAMLEEERKKSDEYRKEIKKLRNQLFIGEDSVFVSASMQSLLGDIRKVAPVDCTVLITGESGVGKEVVAKTIHANSLRNKSPFITVCIPAIPENLLESELFGYEQGAFTGAQKGGKMGVFESAQGGTLFLDEIGDMPLSMQVKILRAIEYGEIRRIGGTTNIHLNVRILAATNRDLPGMVAKGSFREDLYYRLSVVTMPVRPLRERPDAIAPLALRFTKKFSQRYHLTKNIDSKALKELQQYPWPGNIRELRNAMERLVILSDGQFISVADVKAILGNVPAGPAIQPETLAATNSTLSAKDEYAQFERNRILTVLKETGGNKSKAAQLLGMTRARFYRKLEKL